MARTRGKPPPSPYNILYITPPHPHPNGFLSWDFQGWVSKLSQFGLLGFHKVKTFCSDLRSGRGLKQSCSSPWGLSNGVSHSPRTHHGQVNFRLLVVRSQTASLKPSPSFAHNLCCKCPNGPCEFIFDI
jgi:hypothetical protein